MGKKEGQGENRISGIGVTARLIGITMIPIISILIILTFISAKDMRDSMRTTQYQGMAGMAGSVQSAYNIVYQGDFKLDEKTGVLYKGPADLTKTNEMMDMLVEKSGYDMLLTYGDKIEITTMKGKNGERIIGQKIKDQVIIDKVLKGGKEYKDNDTKINGVEYYSYSLPVKNTDGTVVGVISIVNPRSEIDDYTQSRIMIIVVVAVVLLIITLITTTIASKSLAGAVKHTEEALVGLSHGKVNFKLEDRFLTRKDEVGEMARAFEALQKKLIHIISNIKNSSEVLLGSGEELNHMAQQSNLAVEDISKGAVSQAEDVEEATVYVGDMGKVVGEIVDGVETLDETSNEMKNAGDESTNIIEQLTVSNDKTTKAIEHIGNQIKATNDSVQEIGEATKIITAIAEQTSLLALNASIEAARAGEAGKGFAVVADEIGKLADQSNTSAEQIRQTIDNLLEESEKSVEVMESVNVLVAEQQEKLNQTREKFVRVSKGITTSKDDMEVIKSHTDSYFVARKKVADIIQNLSAISEEYAASTQQTTASMEELNATMNLLAEASKNLTDLSRQLDEEIAFFQIDD